MRLVRLAGQAVIKMIWLTFVGYFFTYSNLPKSVECAAVGNVQQNSNPVAALYGGDGFQGQRWNRQSGVGAGGTAAGGNGRPGGRRRPGGRGGGRAQGQGGRRRPGGRRRRPGGVRVPTVPAGPGGRRHRGPGRGHRGDRDSFEEQITSFLYKPNGQPDSSFGFDTSNMPPWLQAMLGHLGNFGNAFGGQIQPNNGNQNTIPTRPQLPPTLPATTPSLQPSVSPLTSICGKNKYSTRGRQYIPSPFDRIVGGSQTQRNEVPWQVRVSASSSLGTALCGGSLINNRAVLTAAHCVVERGTTARAVLGDFSIRHRDRGEETISVSQIFVHPSYSSYTNENDFAILILSKEVTFSENVRPVCLPKSNNNDFNGATALISGWGRLSETNGRLPDTLQKASTRITSLNSCRQIYSRGRISITEPMICASARGIDTCQGDSGGPLTTIVNGRYTLIGVTSFGIGCAKEFPGVYSRVTSALSWIQSTAGSYGVPR